MFQKMYTIVTAYDDDLLSYLAGHGPAGAVGTQTSKDSDLGPDSSYLSRRMSSTAGTASSTSESKIDCPKFEADLIEV